MADSMKIDVDARGMLRALDRLGDLATDEVFAAVMETAEAVSDEMVSRINRQTRGEGVTAGNVSIGVVGPGQGRAASGKARHRGKLFNLPSKEDALEEGIFVDIEPYRRPANLPGWLEFGTVHMLARPFFFASAEVEEGPHRRRLATALANAARKAGG
jgi:hypothetical protein